MTNVRLQRHVVALCAAAWATVGLFKVLSPSRLGFAGVEWHEGYAVALGLAEVGLGAAIAWHRTRAAARVVALLMLTAFLLFWSQVAPDCGCLGAVQLDQAGRTVLLGLLLTFHGAEMALAARPESLRGGSHAA